MENTLGKISSKPTDYKCCNDCNAINFYDNEVCWDCFIEDFTERGSKEVHKWINKEYEFYEELGYTEEEIDNIEVEV